MIQMTFDASPALGPASLDQLTGGEGLSVCDLSGAERFVVWALRWESSVHDDPDFAHDCLQESFERAGLGSLVPVFRGYVAIVHGVPSARVACIEDGLLAHQCDGSDDPACHRLPAGRLVR